MEAAGETTAGIMTAGQIRAALEGVPDGIPVIVVTAPAAGAGEQVIAGTGLGFLDWSNGYRFVPSGRGAGGDGQGTVLALSCREPGLAELDRMVWHGRPHGQE